LQVKDRARYRLRWLATLLGQIATDVFNARRGWTTWTPRLTVNREENWKKGYEWGIKEERGELRREEAFSTALAMEKRSG
jgi:hypothetical protein